MFKLDTVGSESVLYGFPGQVDGELPLAGVSRDSAGNLYGTTFWGNPAGLGVVYKVDAAGHEQVLYSFTGGADGEFPYGGVIPDSAGNLYGTTIEGGTAGVGIVFELDSAGTKTVLHNFTGGADGGS